MSRMSNSWAMLKASATVLRRRGGPGSLAIPMWISLGVGYFFLGLLSSALKGIYSAALYRFATTGDAGEHFQAAMMEQAFRPKKNRW